MTCYDELLALLDRYAPLNCTNVGAFNHQVMKWRQRNAELLTKTQESKESPPTQEVIQTTIAPPTPAQESAPAPAPVSVTPPPKPAPTEVKEGPSDVSVS